MDAFLKGLVIGLSIAAPVGPIGLLCIRRALAEGRLAGFVSGLGAATADAIYGAAAALGLGAITAFLVGQQRWLHVGGAVFLVYLGVQTMRKGAPGADVETKRSPRLGAAYASTLALTLANPMTILSFLGIFAGLGAGAAGTGGRAAALVLGVFLGSAAWWLFLAAAAGWLGSRLAGGGLRGVNLVSGLLIAGFGVWQLGQGVAAAR